MEKLGKCICQRKQSTILCLKCDLFSFGRVNITCSEHKNVFYLMDFRNCVYCKASKDYLKELDVVEYTVGRKINEIKLKERAQQGVQNILM